MWVFLLDNAVGVTHRISEHSRKPIAAHFPNFLELEKFPSALRQTNSRPWSTSHYTDLNAPEKQKGLDFKRYIDSALLEGSPSENCNWRTTR